MRRRFYCSLIIYVIAIFNLKAQNVPFESWAAGINAGLYGIGIQGATSLSPNFKIRIGYDYFKFINNDTKEFDVNVEYSGYKESTQAELTETDIVFPNLKTLVDYYPIDYGIFCITAGFYIGENRASTNGLVKDYRVLVEFLGENPVLIYEDIIITPYSDGRFEGRLKVGNLFKPYLGIGLGRTIPLNKVGFKFELGLVYQGKYSLTSPNIDNLDDDWLNRFSEDINLNISEEILNWWPMVNLSLTYRIR